MRTVSSTCGLALRRNPLGASLGENTAPSIFPSTRALEAQEGEKVDEVQCQETVPLA